MWPHSSMHHQPRIGDVGRHLLGARPAAWPGPGGRRSPRSACSISTSRGRLSGRAIIAVCSRQKPSAPTSAAISRIGWMTAWSSRRLRWTICGSSEGCTPWKRPILVCSTKPRRRAVDFRRVGRRPGCPSAPAARPARAPAAGSRRRRSRPSRSRRARSARAPRRAPPRPSRRSMSWCHSSGTIAVGDVGEVGDLAVRRAGAC